MEIKVNDYVRCKNGRIAKIKAIENNFIYFDGEIYRQNGTPMFECETCFSDFIVKHSKNIIDLIECGDYVNGCKVISILNGFVEGTMEIKLLNGDIIYRHHLEDIKSIVTKELFSSLEYII
ncbi:MAG: hypothetical protein UIM53_00995 [Acutalibacteraceae bacterium]|nr:hypothetical protein [Acutalibacteraceae bacterium]